MGERSNTRVFRIAICSICAMLVTLAGPSAHAVPGPIFTVNSPSGLYARSGPGEEFAPVALLPYLSQIQMQCQLRITTDEGESQIWDKLLDGTWVLDVFLIPTGSNDFNGLVPRCDRPPTGTITSPRPGTEVKPGSRITIRGQFEDDLGIEKVEYFVSTGSSTTWIPLGIAKPQGDGVFTKEYVVTFPTRTVLTFAATITDTGQNVVAFAAQVPGVVVTDRDQGPEGEMTSPKAAAPAIYGRPLSVAATVTDDVGIESVAFAVRTNLGEWTEIGTDRVPVEDSFSVDWTATFPTYQPGVLLAFKATGVDSIGQQVEIIGPNNVVVTQERAKRTLSLRLVRFEDGSFGAAGRLGVPKGVVGCKRGMAVTIEKWVGEGWHAAGTAVTSATGAFATKLKRDFTSTFRASVEEFPKEDGNICLAAASGKTHFGGGRTGN